ncbi:MAG: hypothetical protein AAFQ90_10000, partial [Pseudomonadota bacterium]
SANGADQAARYSSAIKAAQDATNKHQRRARGQEPLWQGNPVAATNLNVPSKGWDNDGRDTNGWPVKDLKLRDPASGNFLDKLGILPRNAANQNRLVFTPTGINGRWMVAKDSSRVKRGDGVYAYYLAPNPADISKALKSYKTAKNFKKIAKQIVLIYAGLKKPPKVRRLTVNTLKGAPLVARSEDPHTNKKRKLVRRKAKDNFDAGRWNALRVGGASFPKESAGNLQDTLVEYAPKQLRDQLEGFGALGKWAKKPPEDNPKLNYKSAARHAEDPIQDYGVLRKGLFWASGKAKPLGTLRKKFGGLFVAAFNKFEQAKEAIKKRFKDKKKGDYLGSNKGSIRKAAAEVAAIVVPKVLGPFMRTMLHTIAECAEEGFQAKLRSLIEETPIDQMVEYAQGLKEKVEKISDDANTYFTQSVDDFLGDIKAKIDGFVGHVNTLTQVAGGIAEIVRGLRIGACVAGLISAPETVGIGAVVGCGAALADWILGKFGLSPVEYIVARTLKSCTTQKAIARLVSGMDFMQQLPAYAGRRIVKGAQKLLRENLTSEIMGKPMGQHAAEMFCNIDEKSFARTRFREFDCGGGGSGSGEFKESKTGEYEIDPNKTPPFKRGDPITPDELRWKGRELSPEGEEQRRKERERAESSEAGGSDDSNDGSTGGDHKDDASSADPQTGGSKRQTDIITSDQNVSIDDGETPKEFRSWFIQGIGTSGFPSRYDSSNQGGQCFPKPVKFMIVDTYGAHLVKKTYDVEICRIFKSDKPYNAGTTLRVAFRFGNNESFTVIDKTTRKELVGYAVAPGKMYEAWMGQRRKEGQ